MYLLQVSVAVVIATMLIGNPSVSQFDRTTLAGYLSFSRSADHGRLDHRVALS